jgi:hypothetical protein
VKRGFSIVERTQLFPHFKHGMTLWNNGWRFLLLCKGQLNALVEILLSLPDFLNSRRGFAHPVYFFTKVYLREGRPTEQASTLIHGLQQQSHLLVHRVGLKTQLLTPLKDLKEVLCHSCSITRLFNIFLNKGQYLSCLWRFVGVYLSPISEGNFVRIGCG